MSNTYSWAYVEAEKLNVPIIVGGEPLAEFVFLVRFSIAVSDGTNSLTYFDQYQFPEPTTPSGYTPADQVTEAMIMGWLQEATMPDGSSVQTVMQSRADAALAAAVAPVASIFTPAS